MSCVRPGVREVRASFPCSVKVLIALDFPELDLPANATSHPTSGGAFSTALALCKNAAWRKFTGLGVALMSVILRFVPRHGTSIMPRSLGRHARNTCLIFDNVRHA